MNRLQSPRAQGWLGSAALHAAILAAAVVVTAGNNHEPTPPSVFQWDVAMRTIAAPAAPPTEPQAAAPTPRAANPVPRRPAHKRAPTKTDPRPVTTAAAPRPSAAAPAQAEPPVLAEAAPAPTPENASQNPPAPAPAPEPAPPAAVAAATQDELLRRIHALKRYPYLALRNGWEGRVTIRAVLTPDGRLLEAHIQESSGYAALDRDALALVKRAAEGGRQAGEIHQAAVLIPITYRIER